MENTLQKWVTITYLAGAALLAYVVFAFATKIGGEYDLEARFRNFDLILRGGSLAIGGLFFLFVSRHSVASKFMNEVIVELSKVTWPTRDETTKATMVVVIMVILAGLVLGFFDVALARLMKAIL